MSDAIPRDLVTSVALAQGMVKQLQDEGATKLGALRNTLEIYERNREKEDTPLTAEDVSRGNYLHSELGNYFLGCPVEEREDVMRLMKRTDVLAGRAEAPVVEGAIEWYGFVFYDPVGGENQVHLCTLGGQGDHDRAKDRLEDQGNTILYDGRRISQDQIDLLSRFSIKKPHEKEAGLDNLLKQLEGETQ